MKTTLYLIRHAEKDSNFGDPPLTEKGVEQAKQTAQYFKEIPVSKIFSSPLLRTQQTAKIIADFLKLNVETNDLLKERFNWGDNNIQSFQEFMNVWHKSNFDRDWKPPIGDSSEEAGERMEEMIEDIGTSNSHIILVTHGGIINDFLRNIFELSYLNKFDSNYISNLDENIGECSITEIEYNGSNFKLSKFASIEHLENLK